MRRLAVFALAACFGAQAFAAGDAASGKQKAQACAACHGPTATPPPDRIFPARRQHYDYLLKALRDYKSGARKNPSWTGR